MEHRINEFLKKREDEDLFRRLVEISPAGAGKISVDGNEYINFSSNDYLSLASHPDLAKAAQKALVPAVGTSASRLMTGSTRLHHELEERIAAFKKKPAALVFNTGYQANVGVISALCGKGDCVFSDRLNHASIVDGIRLSGAGLYRFRHNDLLHLEELLRKNRTRHAKALIVTETIFSMDGDSAPLQTMVRLKNEYDCIFMVDEAHATGIFGANGSGLAEEQDVTEEVDIIVGTFSKALGGFGAYVAASRVFCDYFVNACRSFIYSTSLPASILAADLAAMDVVKAEPCRRKELLANAAYLREMLREKGLDVKGNSQIIPIMIGENKRAVKVSEYLKKKGYWVTPVRPPTVPQGEARLRISLTFDHDKEVLDKLVEDIAGEKWRNGK